MKLLILTQKIDQNDDVLGFFHAWVGKLALFYENITVIALGVGDYNLPPNVKVLSLGKESRPSRLNYVMNFYKYIWRQRENYDKVFVHMNQEYVILGGIFWRIFRKRISLWRNHEKGGLLIRLAVWLAHQIFCTSPFAFVARYKKTKIMPVGVDADFFRNENKERTKNSLLSLGRIAPVKNIHVLIEAAKELDRKEIDFSVDIIGDAIWRDGEYLSEMRQAAAFLEKKGRIRFLGRTAYISTPAAYNNHEIFLNLTNSGSMDKTIFEAMACECLILVSNKSFYKILPSEFSDVLIFGDADSRNLASKAIILMNMGSDKKREIGKRLREIVLAEHSLDVLVKKLKKEI